MDQPSFFHSSGLSRADGGSRPTDGSSFLSGSVGNAVVLSPVKSSPLPPVKESALTAARAEEDRQVGSTERKWQNYQFASRESKKELGFQ